MHSVVGTRYANALAEVVLAPGSNLMASAVTEQLKRVEALLKDAPELRHVMLSPAVASSKKRAVVKQLAPELGLDQKVQNFLFVVIDHRRVHQLSEIREAFEGAVDVALGFVRANITSAQALDDGQRGMLQSHFERLTGKKVHADYTVNPELIGGVIARIGSTVYDGSVKGQLEGLRRKLVTEA